MLSFPLPAHSACAGVHGLTCAVQNTAVSLCTEQHIRCPMSALKPTPQIKNEGPSETTAYNETLLEMNMMPRGEAGGATGGAAVGHAEKAVVLVAAAPDAAAPADEAAAEAPKPKKKKAKAKKKKDPTKEVLKDEEKEQAETTAAMKDIIWDVVEDAIASDAAKEVLKRGLRTVTWNVAGFRPSCAAPQGWTRTDGVNLGREELMKLDADIIALQEPFTYLREILELEGYERCKPGGADPLSAQLYVHKRIAGHILGSRVVGAAVLVWLSFRDHRNDYDRIIMVSSCHLPSVGCSDFMGFQEYCSLLCRSKPLGVGSGNKTVSRRNRRRQLKQIYATSRNISVSERRCFIDYIIVGNTNLRDEEGKLGAAGFRDAWIEVGSPKQHQYTMDMFKNNFNDPQLFTTHECCVCKEDEIQVRFDPCKHSVCCASCAFRLREYEPTRRCPLCRANIKREVAHWQIDTQDRFDVDEICTISRSDGTWQFGKILAVETETEYVVEVDRSMVDPGTTKSGCSGENIGKILNLYRKRYDRCLMRGAMSVQSFRLFGNECVSGREGHYLSDHFGVMVVVHFESPDDQGRKQGSKPGSCCARASAAAEAAAETVPQAHEEGLEYGDNAADIAADNMATSPFKVTMAVSIPFSMFEFNDAKRASFKEALAQALGVSSSDVSIDIVESTSIAKKAVRRLLASGIKVVTSAKDADKSAADTMVSKLTATNINAKLREAGLPPITIIDFKLQ